MAAGSGRHWLLSRARTYTADGHGGTHLELKCRVMRTTVMAGTDKEKKGNAGGDKRGKENREPWAENSSDCQRF